jgi:hypothetical protein
MGVDVGVGVDVGLCVAVDVAVAVAVVVDVLVKGAPGVALAVAWAGGGVAVAAVLDDAPGAAQAARITPRHKAIGKSHIVAGLLVLTRRAILPQSSTCSGCTTQRL